MRVTHGQLDEQMHQQWRSCAWALGARQHVDFVYGIVAAKYGESHRAYHNLGHIGHMLGLIDEAGDECANPDLVRMAAFFHDIEYNPLMSQNELASANLAKTLLRMMGISAASAELVHSMIVATDHLGDHQDGSQAGILNEDALVLLDADLAILGTPVAQFDEYERGIRQEYGWVTESAFAAGRRAVLEGFLARPRIFTTDYFYGRFEAAARENMERTLLNMK